MFLVFETSLGGLELFLSETISLNEFAIEAALLLLIDHIVCIVIDVLMLLDFLRVIDDHICLEVKFRSIESDVFTLLHRILKVLLHLILKIAGNWMMIEVLPLDSFIWVNCKHPLDDILSDL